MSKYLNPNNSLQRLREDWQAHNGIIIAVDFDSTLIPYMDDERGYMNDFEKVRQQIRDLKTAGCTIIINTASEESRWADIMNQLADMKIGYHYFNKSPDYIPNIGRNGKVYANLYYDDRGGLYETYTHAHILLLEWRVRELEMQVKSIGKQLSQP